MSDDNLFDLDDFVPAGGTVPEHLKGKSADEVAQYYSSILQAHKDKPPVPPTPPPKDQPLTAADVAPAMGTMIASAKMVAKASLDGEAQKLWDRFFTDTENVMKAGFRGVQLADAQNWIFAFNQVMGSKATTLMKESRDAEVARRTAESSSTGSTPPPAEITLEPIHEELAEGLLLSKDQFKHGIELQRTNKWPLTFDNRR